MARARRKKLLVLVYIGASLFHSSLFGLVSLSKADPYPVYTTLDPQSFLYTRDTLRMKGFSVESDDSEAFGLSLSPFGQNANLGKNIKKEDRNIGDLGGRWGMIGLLMGDCPSGKTLPPTLLEAQGVLFPGQAKPISDPLAIDSNEQFGFFTIPIKYRKRGLRFDFSAQIVGDLGISFDGGVVDICQTVTGFENLTGSNSSFTDPCNPNITADNVNKYLMDRLKLITQEIGLNTCNYHKASLEDIRAHLWWRHAYEINFRRSDWPDLLVIPFLMFSGSAAIGNKAKPELAFALSSGSNDHNAVGASGGLNLDFADTVKIGAHAGVTHFFKNDFCNFRVPNSTCQSGIYPFATAVSISPGLSWEFGAKLEAWHFLDRLSFYFQYMIAQHHDDKITLKKPDAAFKPEVLECRSTWKVQLANIALNYDISPYLSIGFLWQAPLSQRNAYRNTTVMFSFNAVY